MEELLNQFHAFVSFIVMIKILFEINEHYKLLKYQNIINKFFKFGKQYNIHFMKHRIQGYC
jgi:hypothetical protein